VRQRRALGMALGDCASHFGLISMLSAAPGMEDMSSRRSAFVVSSGILPLKRLCWFFETSVLSWWVMEGFTDRREGCRRCGSKLYAGSEGRANG
jgi:hypothetical protein